MRDFGPPPPQGWFRADWATESDRCDATLLVAPGMPVRCVHKFGHAGAHNGGEAVPVETPPPETSPPETPPPAELPATTPEPAATMEQLFAASDYGGDIEAFAVALKEQGSERVFLLGLKVSEDGGEPYLVHFGLRANEEGVGGIRALRDHLNRILEEAAVRLALSKSKK